MSRRLKPLPVLAGDQRDASDPEAHAALSASAGTGKTQVLTARVLRLLLRGVDPGAILCLTFTKAGAAEMANRISERLAAWVRMSDVDLRHDLFALGEENSPPALQRARRLFARVLETPGGLRIQTIHGFAQTLLASFPAEAGISPGFQPIEGRAEAELSRRTLATLLADAEASGNNAMIADVQALSLRLGEGGAEEYLMACARAEEAIESLGDPASFERALLEAIGIKEGSAEQGLAARLTDDEIDVPTIEALVEVNRAWGTKTAETIVANLTEFLAASPVERIGLLDRIGKGLVTGKDEPCKATAGQLRVEPEYAELLSEYAIWLIDIRRLCRAAALASVQAAGLRAGQDFARAYRLAKRAAGVADFDDLIVCTRRLLGIEGMGQWVRFKLDQRTDHVLVDEAQDTNADQWAIVDALAEEYFSGQSESEQRWRTLFMVGDYKQAIFGFQGTDPRQFERFRALVSDRAAAAGEAALDSDAWAREFRDLSIDASFRSSPAVLETVDALIGEVGHEAMGLVRRPNPHGAAHHARPGEVLWWPPYEPPARAEDEADPGEEGWVAEPVRLYADALARQVRDWLAEAAPLACTERPLCAGDVLILVRSRSELASLLVARLYAHGVPVAGIDRLHLSKPLAVKDLLAAIGFAVQPQDDLNLAGLLVSPIIGLDQQRLFDLAHNRSGSLWQALQARRAEYAEAHALLAGLLQRADYVTPARFLETLLSGPADARRKLLHRLGEAARDPIEELVASAIEFEKQEGASLDRFLAWFARGDVEVKRDPESSGNAVRVMTVHGAKGLEAPLVILADATHDPARVGRRPLSMDLPLGEGDRPVPLLRPRASELVDPYKAIAASQAEIDQEEHWRLLYVGLTRARERLVIAGWQPGRGEVVENSWHSASARALMALGSAPADCGPWGAGLSWRGAVPVGSKRLRAGRRLLDPPVVPDWVRRMAPQEERPPRPLSPSSIIADNDPLPPPSPELRAAAERGSLLHALFERLPGVAPADRQSVALKWLERAVSTESRRQEIAGAALAVIDDERFADLFGPDALAEAPIAATLPDGRVIAGTVDRLCIGDEVVRVVDFKTGRAVPSGAADVPSSHRAQMQAYADALGVIFPGRRVEAALLYTSGPELIVLPG